MTTFEPQDRHSLNPSLASVRPVHSGFPSVVGVGCVAFVAAVLGGSRLTHEHVAEPVEHVVSGTPGFRTINDGTNERWAAGRVTIVIDGSVGKLGTSADDAVKAAFGAWAASGANLPALMFDVRDVHGQAARDGVNRVLLAPITLPGHEKDVAVTVAYVNEANGEIQEADIILNAAYPFGALADGASGDSEKEDCGLHYDVQSIVTHESGHFFGLGEDLTDPKASMYFRSTPCEIHKRNLTESDRGTMASLYKTESSRGVPSGPPPPATGGCN